LSQDIKINTLHKGDDVDNINNNRPMEFPAILRGDYLGRLF